MGIHATELGFTQDARLGAIDADASTLGEVSSAVEEHAQALRSIAGDLGLSGLVADAAGEAVNDLGKQLLDLADAVTAVQSGVTVARVAMATAQAAHDALPKVALTSHESTVVAQYAAIPGAGYAASAQREYYLQQHELAREAAAKGALDELAASLGRAVSVLQDPGNDATGGISNGTGSSGGTVRRVTVPSLPVTTVPPLPRVTAPTIPDPVRVTDAVVTTPTLPVPGDPAIDPRPIPNVDGSVGGTVPGSTHTVGGSGWTPSGPGSGSGPSWSAGLAVGGLALGAGGLTRGLATGGGLAGLGAGTGAGGIGGAGGRGATGVLGGTGPGTGAAGTSTSTGTGTGTGAGSTGGGMTALGGGGGATAGRGGVLGSGSGRTSAMPGGGSGAAGSSKKRRRDALGYLAPELDELEDAVLPSTPRGAHAGDRDSAPLPVAFDDEA